MINLIILSECRARSQTLKLYVDFREFSTKMEERAVAREAKMEANMEKMVELMAKIRAEDKLQMVVAFMVSVTISVVSATPTFENLLNSTYWNCFK